MNDEFEKIQVVDNRVGVIDPVAYGKGSIFYNKVARKMPHL